MTFSPVILLSVIIRISKRYISLIFAAASYATAATDSNLLMHILLTISIMSRGVTGYLNLGGQVVSGASPLPGGVFYFAKTWMGNCPPYPPITYAPDVYLV